MPICPWQAAMLMLLTGGNDVFQAQLPVAEYSDKGNKHGDLSFDDECPVGGSRNLRGFASSILLDHVNRCCSASSLKAGA
jgi:hypothetical protein